MTVSTPPRPPSPARVTPDTERLSRDEIEALVEALIEEAKRETRRRHRRYWALAALVTFVGVVVLIVLEGGAASRTASPALSARMSAAAQAGTSRLAFTQSAWGGQTSGGLYVMNVDGSGKRRLAYAGHTTPSWSPDGRKIAFGGQEVAPFGGLRVVNADGSGQQRLTMGNHPAWSPDGRRIAFTRGGSARSKGSYLDIYVINADGSGERKLTSGNGGRPVWSPDGQKIAFTSRQPRYSRYFDIYVINADGSRRQHLARTSFDSVPAWSPDGRQITYTRAYDIRLMNADGSGQRRLTSGAARDLAPSWSPDGRTIAFDRRVGRGRIGNVERKASTFEVYVMSADGSGQRRLARGAGPIWSPDGKKIAFSRAVGNGVGSPYARDNWEIFVMKADGTNQQNVTRTRRWDESWLAWSPAQK